MISKEYKSSMEGICSEKHDHSSDTGLVKANEALCKHSEIINSLSENNDRIIKSKNKALWRLSFEVSQVSHS